MLDRVCEAIRQWLNTQSNRGDQELETKIKTLFDAYQEKGVRSGVHRPITLFRNISPAQLSELTEISQALSRKIEQIATQRLNQRQIAIIGDLETNSEKGSILVQDLAREFDGTPSGGQNDTASLEKTILTQLGWKESV